MHRRVRIRHLLAGAVALVALIFTTGVPAGATGPTVLLDGLSSPKGLTLDGNGNPVISQGALGPPGPTLRFKVGSGQVEQLTGGPQSTVGIAWARTGDAFWTLLGNEQYRALYRPEPKVRPTVIGRLKAFANANPDPYDLEGNPTESNPFAIATTLQGDALVADAAANSVVRISKSGQASLVARLAPELVKTDHIPPDEIPGLPPQLPAEAVATSVAVSGNGTIYIGELKGFPFRPGTSRIWKVPAGTTNAVCSANPAIPSSGCTLYKGGLTSIAALAVAPNGSAVYAFEYAEDGVGAFEAGCFGPAGCPPAVLLKLQGGQVTELARGQLSEPGALAIRGGSLYATDHVLSPNAGRLLKLAG
jgi:hypothetical protein